ncbi:copper-transporting ATPase, putative [Plasmodium relictum]|uniref:Copper-transporting ATPase, putative n=1 Tax=Plasmodium relictum TaxID=85471 RepID=A0A1J1H3C4_PLARL|nr:copper-transporting ATPase, putative [Plasmodium relictum]CRG99256.1 copper-transporting ATPase, putative [Plasmodium relictum]
MAQNKLLINRINKNIKNKIRKLNIEGINKITFIHNSASISYDDCVIDKNIIIEKIKDLDINGYFEEDENEYINNRFTSNEKLTSLSFYSNNKDINEHINDERKRKITYEESKMNICEINNNNNLNNVKNNKEKNDNNNNVNASNDKISANSDNTCMKDCTRDSGVSIYKKEKLIFSSNYNLDETKDNKNEDNKNEDNKNEDNKNEDNKNKENKNEHNKNGYLNCKINENKESNEKCCNSKKNRDDKIIKNTYDHTINYSEIPFQRYNENVTNEEKKKVKKKNNKIMNLLTHFKKKKEEKNIYENNVYINIDRRNLLSTNKRNNVFYDYENYKDGMNIYVCELKIYNMTCDNCGNKIINFLKNKNFIIEGSSFATENKIKLKIDMSENKLHGCNIRNYVNKIMTEIKDSGFNNDLLDIYKDDNNNCSLFEITLYVYRDDVIKSYELLKDLKGIKNVEYDVKKEYIYILYNPEIIGIRYILEELKKKKNIDAYYDEDKERYFKSTKNNEKNNRWKLIELICCFFLSIIIIILNNYQMNMGFMNKFYSDININNYASNESLSMNLIKNNVIHNLKNNVFNESITKSNNHLNNESKSKDYYTYKKDEESINYETNYDPINKIGKTHTPGYNIKNNFTSFNNVRNMKHDLHKNDVYDSKKGSILNYKNNNETSKFNNIDNSKNVDTSFSEVIIPNDSEIHDTNNFKTKNLNNFTKGNNNSKNPKNDDDTSFIKIDSSNDSGINDTDSLKITNSDNFKKDFDDSHNLEYKNTDNLKNCNSYFNETIVSDMEHKNPETNKNINEVDKKKKNKYLTENSHNQKELKRDNSDFEKTQNNTNKRNKLKKILNIFMYSPLHNLIIHSFNIKLDTKILPSLTIRLLLIFLLSSIVYIYYGFNFVLNGYKNLKNKIINMNVLISISSSFSYFYSLFLLLFCIIFSIDADRIPLYFDSSALLICIMKFGSEIENFLVSFTKKKIENLYESKTKHVYILEKNKDEEKKSQKELTKCFSSSLEIRKNNISNNDNNNIYNVNETYSNNRVKNAINNNNSGSNNNNSLKEDITNTFSNNKLIISSNDCNSEGKKDLFFSYYIKRNIEINKILYEDKNINLNDYIINSYPIQFIQKNDVLVFYEGMTLLIDGIKINNEISGVDESMISGEKKLIKKYKGDKVYAGSKCVEGIIILYIDDISKGNYIEYVKKLLDDINCKKTDLQLYADKVASIFIPAIILLCFIVFFIWFFLTFFNYVDIGKGNYFKLNKFFSCVLFSIHFSLSILCVACPCAVGLASPLSIAISSYICSNIGIIIKNINIFEIFLQCNHFIFDKTGTLTVGKPVVNKIYISNNIDIFIDQLLKNFTNNNILVNFTDNISPNDIAYISRDENNFYNICEQDENNIYNNTVTMNNCNNNNYNVYDKRSNNLYDFNFTSEKLKQSSFSHDDYSNGVVMEDSYVINKNFDSFYKNKEMKKKEKKREKENSNTLNFIESFSCFNKDITFYSFTTKKEYFKIEIKELKKKKGNKIDQYSLSKQKTHHFKGEKSILNNLTSFITEKTKKKKYKKILDNSLKENFINYSENCYSNDDSYYSETRNYYNCTNVCNYNKINNNRSYGDTNITNNNDHNIKSDISNGNEYFKNNIHLDDKNNLKEKINNWLYLFLSLSLNIEKYSNHLFAESINTFINKNFHIKEKFQVYNLINERNQGINCVINDLSITIGTLFYCYTKYKNTFCTKPEVEQEKLNVKNMEKYLYSCDCNVHKTYQFLYNYSNSKKNEGNNIIFMCIEGIIIGFFTLVDSIKPEVFDLIKYLKKKKKKVYVCTGDNYMNALYISKILGISKENISSNTLPLEKVHFVKKIRSLNDGKVCMIGDGINDCFALKSADLGLSLSTRSNVVMDSADGCIVDNNISVIMKLFEISRKTLLVIKFNFLFSFFVNIFFILLASGAFYSLNYIFSPFLFTFLMFCSSVIVILSSLSLKLFLRNV